MQTVRQVVHVLGDASSQIQRFSRLELGLLLAGSAQQLEIDRQDRELLADVIVQLARDAGAFGFLCAQQARPEVADASVTHLQVRLTSAQRVLGAAAACALNQQSCDQQRLNHENREGTDDVVPEAMPDPWLAKPDAR